MKMNNISPAASNIFSKAVPFTIENSHLEPRFLDTLARIPHAIGAFNGWLYMGYQDSNPFRYYITRSQNGVDWQDT